MITFMQMSITKNFCADPGFMEVNMNFTHAVRISFSVVF